MNKKSARPLETATIAESLKTKERVPGQNMSFASLTEGALPDRRQSLGSG